ncbi:MAG: zinc-dependent alcohol dehydrogenase family protein, partial [Candidatus Ratteibacteria bacterium]
MKAAILEKIGNIVVSDIPEPEIKQEEVLIKVKFCGICGTDIKLFKGEYSAKVPVILGHEFSGEIVKVGKEVKNFRIGDRVVVDPNESCGKCFWCKIGKTTFCNYISAYGVFKNGGFAEYVVCNEKAVYKIPDGLDLKQAIFTEPISCAVHCLDKAEIKTGEIVAIIGAGTMGQIITQMVKNSGASEIIVISRSEWKLNFAKRFGATYTIKSDTIKQVKEEISKITNGLFCDVVIEAVGSPETVEESFSLVRKGGRIVIFGFSPEGQTTKFIPFDFLSREITLISSWVNPYTFQRALEILKSKKINVEALIYKEIKLDD